MQALGGRWSGGLDLKMDSKKGGTSQDLRSPNTKEDARQALPELSDFYSMSKEKMEALG